jgi:RNA polymerase sigma-70 factor (ECF subfamily)
VVAIRIREASPAYPAAGNKKFQHFSPTSFQPFSALLLLYTVRHLEPTAHILTVIVRKASQGDPTAQGELYAQYNQKMFSICVRMTGNRADSEDLLQEAFIKAFNNLGQLREPHLFEPWLRRIIVNECIQFARKRLSTQFFEEQYTEIPDAEDVNWLQLISFEQIHFEIKNLPDGCREIFNLYVLEDHSHQQIAVDLNISVSTSKSQYHRARQLLKERLRKQFIQYG